MSAASADAVAEETSSADGADGAANGGADGVTAPADEHPGPLTLVLNLGEEVLPAPGEVLEAVSGADMLDAVGPAPEGTVPAHGIAVVR